MHVQRMRGISTPRTRAESDIAKCSDAPLPPPFFLFHYPLTVLKVAMKNFISIRLRLELEVRSCDSWDCELRLTWPAPTCSSIHARSDCLRATGPRCTSHVTTGSVKPRSSHGAFNQTKGFQIALTPASPYPALAIKAPLSQQKILQRTSSSPWTFTPLFDWKPKEKEGFFCSCKLHRADASKTFVSPRFRKQLFVLWEPREFGDCGDKSAFGDVFDTCNEDPV